MDVECSTVQLTPCLVFALPRSWVLPEEVLQEVEVPDLPVEETGPLLDDLRNPSDDWLLAALSVTGAESRTGCAP